MLFDTHAHYDDEQFDIDRDALLASMQEHGIGGIVNNGTTVSSSEFSVALAGKYPFIYAAVGIHPEEMDGYNEENLARIEALLTCEKVVAVGEIGLDYHWRSDNKELQKEALRRQLELARK
ncbi:MAG: TatD family hydrolase, partial [Oscillospiraceae bacterium]|nr:TatD family hydrolase [Oscillospiraceae bacterium]